MDEGKEGIQAILSKGEALSFDEIMLCMEQIRKDGNTFIIKLDGMRSVDEKQYTVAVGFPGNTTKDVIRADSTTLKEACLHILRQYFHV